MAALPTAHAALHLPLAGCRDAKATRRATSMLNRMDTLKLAADKFDGRQSMARLKVRLLE